MSLATAIATGAINTAVAVLDTNKPIAAVMMKRPVSSAYGPDIGAEQLEHWEASINTLFAPGFPGMIICQYNRGRLSPEALPAAVLVAVVLAAIPLLGYLAVVAVPVAGTRLNRRAESRHAGLRILAKD